MSVNQLDPKQVNQLIEAVLASPMSSYDVLKGPNKLDAEQQQKLVDAVAKDPMWAQFALNRITWLTELQKSQLKLVV